VVAGVVLLIYRVAVGGRDGAPSRRGTLLQRTQPTLAESKAKAGCGCAAA